MLNVWCGYCRIFNKTAINMFACWKLQRLNYLFEFPASHSSIAAAPLLQNPPLQPFPLLATCSFYTVNEFLKEHFYTFARIEHQK